MADRRLQVFHTVARLLSFTKAADALHMTQPAVTFQVRQLEEQFNTRLFDRAHNRISLTAAGQQVYEHSERIFAQYSELENAVRELTGDFSGTLQVGASTTIAEYMLPSLLGQFNAKYPDINIQLKVSNTEGIVSMVDNNVIDLGVVEGPVSNKSLVVEGWRWDRLAVIVPPDHPLTRRDSVGVDEVSSYPFICREEGSGTREVIAEYLSSSGGEAGLNISMELGSPESIKGAVEARMGISIVSQAIIQKELRLGTLAAINLDPMLERPFSFVHQKQKFRHHAIGELLDFARGYYEAQPARGAARLRPQRER